MCLCPWEYDTGMPHIHAYQNSFKLNDLRNIMGRIIFYLSHFTAFDIYFTVCAKNNLKNPNATTKIIS